MVQKEHGRLSVASCFVCGSQIPKGRELRKSVYVGASVGGFNLSSNVVLNWLLNAALSKRRVGIRSYYGLRTICQNCAIAMEKEEKKRLLVIAIFCILVLSIFGVVVISHR